MSCSLAAASPSFCCTSVILFLFYSHTHFMLSSILSLLTYRARTELARHSFRGWRNDLSFSRCVPQGTRARASLSASLGGLRDWLAPRPRDAPLSPSLYLCTLRRLYDHGGIKLCPDCWLFFILCWMEISRRL